MDSGATVEVANQGPSTKVVNPNIDLDAQLEATVEQLRIEAKAKAEEHYAWAMQNNKPLEPGEVIIPETLKKKLGQYVSHGPGPKFTCEYPGCKCNRHSFTRKDDVFRHIISTVCGPLFVCPAPGCTSRSHQKPHAELHINTKHEREPHIKWHKCSHIGCEEKWKDPSPRAKHQKTCAHPKPGAEDDNAEGGNAGGDNTENRRGKRKRQAKVKVKAEPASAEPQGVQNEAQPTMGAQLDDSLIDPNLLNWAEYASAADHPPAADYAPPANYATPANYAPATQYAPAAHYAPAVQSSPRLAPAPAVNDGTITMEELELPLSLSSSSSSSSSSASQISGLPRDNFQAVGAFLLSGASPAQQQQPEQHQEPEQQQQQLPQQPPPSPTPFTATLPPQQQQQPFGPEDQTLGFGDVMQPEEEWVDFALLEFFNYE